MKDEGKTKEQLIHELLETRQRLVALEATETKRKRAEEELEQLRRQNELILNSAGEGIYGLDLQGRTTFANPAAARMIGWEVEELIGQPQHDILHHTKPNGAPYPREECPIYAASKDGAVHHVDNEVFWRKDGTSFPVEYTSTPIRDERGELAGAVVTFRDITERKRAEGELTLKAKELEESNAKFSRAIEGKTRANKALLKEVSERKQAEDALRKRRAELERSNAELEQFAYSVSHDLRAPLRAIEGFSQALVEDYAEMLDAQAKDYLERVRAAGERLARMIDHLLHLSRVTRADIERETVDLSAITQAITEDLRMTEQEREVEFVIAKGVVAQCDVRLIRAVIQNLLGNAWKFTKKRPRARIEFGVTKNDGEKAYFVRDNGAGFNMEYANKLFGAFQRLHTTDEFPGTGIGLATVQRIVHRHGGRVWAEGAVDQGATFYFTIESTRG